MSILVLVILALIIALFVGLGFVVKWLFIIAAIAALIWLIAFFMRGSAREVRLHPRAVRCPVERGLELGGGQEAEGPLARRVVLGGRAGGFDPQLLAIELLQK